MANTLDIVKGALRMPSSVTMYDDELNALIDAAQLTMGAAGVSLEHEDLAVINSACIMYVKANFGNRTDAEKCGAAFNAIVKQRALIHWEVTDADN